MASLNEKFSLEKTKPLKKTIAGTGAFLFALVIFGFFFFVNFVVSDLNNGRYTPFFFIVVLLIFIFFFPLKYIYEVYYMKYYFYDVEGKNIIIRKGVFSRNEITLPMNRLQDVYVDQDILDRLFGLYDVHVSTATAVSGVLSHIDGLNKENAESIKKIILAGIHKKK